MRFGGRAGISRDGYFAAAGDWGRSITLFHKKYSGIQPDGAKLGNGFTFLMTCFLHLPARKNLLEWPVGEITPRLMDCVARVILPAHANKLLGIKRGKLELPATRIAA